MCEQSYEVLEDYWSDYQAEWIVSCLRGDVHVNTRDPAQSLQTVAMRLCHCNVTPGIRLGTLRLILAREPDLRLTDSSGRTILHHACIGQCYEILETLASYGSCDPNVTDVDGNTALLLAVASANKTALQEYLSTFIHLGLDFTARNNKGKLITNFTCY